MPNYRNAGHGPRMMPEDTEVNWCDRKQPWFWQCVGMILGLVIFAGLVWACSQIAPLDAESAPVPPPAIEDNR